MPDLLLDALPVIDLLEITASTSAVATLTRRDQSSVSRIYRQASNRLGLEFSKNQQGDYRARANRALLHDLRRSSQQIRIQELRQLRWLSAPWCPPLQPPPLPCSGTKPLPICAFIRDHVLDLAVMPGRDLLPTLSRQTDNHLPLPLEDGALIAWPLQREQGATDLMVLRADLATLPPLLDLQLAIREAHQQAFMPREALEWPH